MNQPKSDEIDLQELAINIVRYFMRYAWFISSCTAAGIVLGVVGYNLMPDKFESHMILQSDILTESYTEKMTERLDVLVRGNNDSILATRFNLSHADAEAIRLINIESVKEKVKADEEDQSTNFLVTVEVDNKSILPKLQEGIINYFHNNEFVKARVRQREESLRLIVDELDKEIQSLDSLRERIGQGKPVYSKSAEMMMVDPANIYKMIVELTEKKIEYKDKLDLSAGIQVVEGFIPVKKPASPKLPIAILAGLALGFFGSIAALTLQKLVRMANESGNAAV